MEIDLDHLSVIDWATSIKVTGKKENAEELLILMLKQLPSDILKIKQHYFDQNYSDLRQQLHKLRGALRYISLPRLESVVVKLESELKDNIMVGLPYLFDKLDSEVKLLLQQC